jgi:NADP-dependent aldehyde dehydrogenase
MTTLIHGTSLIRGLAIAPGEVRFAAASPMQSGPLPPDFFEATESDVDEALAAAEGARGALERAGAEGRAGLLEEIALELEKLGAPLLERARLETGLSQERLASERNRTTGQLRLLAALLREERWNDVRVEKPLPERQPLPRPGLRRTLVPLGPVAVFGASNFPLAYSVAGGDTASALAAGCPVVVKGHPAHPGTSELTGKAILRALDKRSLPPGVFALLQGRSHGLGEGLVRHPLLCAAGFTGSLRGGRALFDVAHARTRPIPFFAEMGSLNPVFVLPGALHSRGAQLAAGLTHSVTQGGGQFCTKPGVVFGLAGPAFDAFQSRLEEAIRASLPATLLHAEIRRAYGDGAARAASLSGVRVLAEATMPGEEGLTEGRPRLLATDAATYLNEPLLHAENFGPSTLLVEAPDLATLLEIAGRLEGQLTAAVHGGEGDAVVTGALFAILEQRAGRLIYNGYPTGVEVCASMQHGGPYPASTDGRYTAVGTAAIQRWLRPVCYQDPSEAPRPFFAERPGVRLEGQGGEAWKNQPETLAVDSLSSTTSSSSSSSS